MNTRPKIPANARNLNCCIIGSSGSGKTRFWLTPQLLQAHSSYVVVVDPKGGVLGQVGGFLQKRGYKIKVFNSIDFSKSMHYNPLAYIRNEADILKFVDALISNTKGEGKEGDPFWTKSETLLYCALIAYIIFEGPAEDRNMNTLVDMISGMEVKEDDEDFMNAVDYMFAGLEKRKPDCFAVKQYKKYKLASGSGKSSVLEAIRYIIGLPVQTDKEYKDSLIKNIFGSGGKAILSVVDKHGKRYSISRIQGERVNILDEVGNDLNITALSLFDGVQYFGQKDLSSSSDHENCLLEKFVSGKVGQKADVDSCVAELITAVTQLLDVGKIPAQIEEATTKKAEVEHRMSIFKEKGVDAKLKKQTGYTKDREKLIAIQAKISSVLRSLHNSYKLAPMLAEELQGFESEYNKDIFVAATNVLTSIDHQLQQIGNTIQQIQSQSIEFETVMKNLTNRIDSLADEFAEIKREINDESLDVDAFVTMTADLERYKNQLKALEEKATSRAKIEMAFKKAARERNEILLTLFKAYKTEVERINGSQNELKIQIEFKGDRETFKNQLKSDFRGTSISDAKYQVISEKFNDYVAIVEDWILNGGKEMQTIISSSEYAKLSVKLQEQYSDLIKRQVMNKVEIYYHEKLLRHHSIGQRASALILFILAQSDNDIILIDQPEDDLDNKIIYDEVISSIVKKKQGIQFIFATHNANIPVLGDAERVLVVEYQDTKIDVSQGNIDLKETHKQIVDIMEGGKEAFDKRQLIYTSWK